VTFLHPYQVTDLRTNTATGQWLDIQKAAMTGGEVEDNPIFDGSLGVYNGAILHEDVRVSQGVNGAAAITTVRRAVMAGAQSAALAFGRVTMVPTATPGSKNSSITRTSWVWLRA
jgi:hypothetical protein